MCNRVDSGLIQCDFNEIWMFAKQDNKYITGYIYCDYNQRPRLHLALAVSCGLVLPKTDNDVLGLLRLVLNVVFED